MHDAQLRVELSQSRKEQREYLKNVELSRVLDKRAEKKRLKGEEPTVLKRKDGVTEDPRPVKKQREIDSEILCSIF